MRTNPWQPNEISGIHLVDRFGKTVQSIQFRPYLKQTDPRVDFSFRDLVLGIGGLFFANGPLTLEFDHGPQTNKGRPTLGGKKGYIF